jgi:hypothetical protein
MVHLAPMRVGLRRWRGAVERPHPERPFVCAKGRTACTETTGLRSRRPPMPGSVDPAQRRRQLQPNHLLIRRPRSPSAPLLA